MPNDEPRHVRTGADGLMLGTAAVRSPWRSILFLGGSTTENNEVDEPYRFPYLVGRHLSKDLNADVVGTNAGVRGHTTQESLSLFLNHPSKAIDEASAVVVMHNINDRLLLALRGSYRAQLQDWTALSVTGITKSFENAFAVVYQNAKYASNIIFLTDKVVTERLTRGPSSSVTEESIDMPDKSIELSKKLYASNLEVIVATIRAKGKFPVLMTQPLGKASKFQDEFNEIVRLVAAKNDVFLIDLDDEVKQRKRQELFYPDAIHFNNEGSIWASRIIADSLRRVVFLGENTRASATPQLPQAWPCTSNPVERSLSTTTQLPSFNFPGRYPSFDRSGRFLLSKRHSKNDVVIEIRDLSTGSVRAVTQALAPDELKHPAWINGTSEAIVYVAKRGRSEHLYKRDLKTNKEAILTPDPTLVPSIPAVGKSGTLYFPAFTADENGKSKSAPDLYALSPDGRTLTQLTDTPWEEWRPVVSPDELFLFYISDRDGGFDIFRMELRTRQVKKIVSEIGDQWDPALSPDGRWLVFASRLNGNFDLYLLDLNNGASPLKLTSSIEDEWDPSFTNDGKGIVYATTSAEGSRIRGICLHTFLQ